MTGTCCSRTPLTKRQSARRAQAIEHVLRNDGIDATICLSHWDDIEHPHLLITQVGFTVTGPKRKVDEFAQGLTAEEQATFRTDTVVMLSPL